MKLTSVTDEQMKQEIEGFTQFMRSICKNPNLSVPKDLADRYGISEEYREKGESQEQGE